MWKSGAEGCPILAALFLCRKGGNSAVDFAARESTFADF